MQQSVSGSNVELYRNEGSRVAGENPFRDKSLLKESLQELWGKRCGG